MSFVTFQFHILLDEIAARPKSQNLFTSLNNNCDISLVTRTELDLFFNFLVFLLNDYNSLLVKQNDKIMYKLNITGICFRSLYIPGYFYKNSSYFNFLSSHSFLAPLKGFFD